MGCHVALECSSRGYETYLLERHARLGQETSTRNSGVLHAGIYYARDSLKARLCVEGNALSRSFFQEHGIEFREAGKFIIARTDAECAEIERLYANAKANGARVEMTTPDKVRDRIPYIHCRAALFSPATAIIETAGYIECMKALLYRNGVTIVAPCTVRAVRGAACDTDRGEVEADIIVNCAGLYADEIANSCGLSGYEVRPLKGDYYATVGIECRVPVYPPPTAHLGTLGVHLTPTFGREVLLGPSETTAQAKDDYQIRTPKQEFSSSLESMVDTAAFSGIELYEGYSGNRPRVYYKGTRCQDFVIIKHPSHVVHLLGIESPGLTAAPAIARHLMTLV